MGPLKLRAGVRDMCHAGRSHTGSQPVKAERGGGVVPNLCKLSVHGKSVRLPKLSLFMQVRNKSTNL